MTGGTGEKGSAAKVLREPAEAVGVMGRYLVSHSARRGPTFNACLSAGKDPGSILHVNLRPVPGFSGGVKVFCYTGFVFVYVRCTNFTLQYSNLYLPSETVDAGRLCFNGCLSVHMGVGVHSP